MKKIVRIALVVIVLLSAALLIPLALHLSVEDVLSLAPASPLLAALVIIGLFCLKNVAMFIPISVLYLATGMLFPPPVAVLVAYLGLAAEMTIGFFVGRKIGRERAYALVEKRPKAERFFDFVCRNDAAACFLTRLVPLPVPIDAVSIFFGATGVPYWKYICFSLLGISTPMIPFVLAGESILTPLSPSFLIPFGIALLVTGGGFAGYMIYLRCRKKRGEKR